MHHEHYVTRWIHAARRGDEFAASELWNRYFERLTSLARSRMTSLPRSSYDEEDAAISTFQLLCQKLRDGKYPGINDRDELWRLMLTVLFRKVNRRAVYEKASKRANTVQLDERVIQFADVATVSTYV